MAAVDCYWRLRPCPQLVLLAPTKYLWHAIQSLGCDGVIGWRSFPWRPFVGHLIFNYWIRIEGIN